MTAIATTDSRRYSPRKLLILAAIGAVVGAIVGYSTVTALRSVHVGPRDLGWTDAIALWIGVVFIGYSLMFAYLSTNRRQLAKMLEGEQATVMATTKEVTVVRLQTLVLALAGMLLIAPIFVQKLLLQNASLGAEVYAGIVLLFGVQSWANARVWRSSDEFARRSIAMVAAWTFAIGQGALFLWAAAEHLHLVAPRPAWNLFSLLMLLYLVVSAFVTVRQSRC